MFVQVIPLDASKPNVIELERVYLPFVIASDDKHGAYLLRVYVELSKMGVNYPSWIIRICVCMSRNPHEHWVVTCV